MEGIWGAAGAGVGLIIGGFVYIVLPAWFAMRGASKFFESGTSKHSLLSFTYILIIYGCAVMIGPQLGGVFEMSNEYLAWLIKFAIVASTSYTGYSLAVWVSFLVLQAKHSTEDDSL